MFGWLTARRRLNERVAFNHRPQFILRGDGTVTVACPPPGCGHAIEGCTDAQHAAEQHLVYARHVEAGHIGRGRYVPDVLARATDWIPSQPDRFSPQARRVA